jgi:amidohydrolase
VIPETARLYGTVRTFSESVRDAVHQAIRERVGEKGSAEIVKKTKVLVNDARMCAIVRRAAESVVGAEHVLGDVRTMGGEDFASFAAAVPGCFFFVGAAPGSNPEPHHSPRFDVDERALPIGLEVMTRAATLYLKEG